MLKMQLSERVCLLSTCVPPLLSGLKAEIGKCQEINTLPKTDNMKESQKYQLLSEDSDQILQMQQV